MSTGQACQRFFGLIGADLSHMSRHEPISALLFILGGIQHSSRPQRPQEHQFFPSSIQCYLHCGQFQTEGANKMMATTSLCTQGFAFWLDDGCLTRFFQIYLQSCPELNVNKRLILEQRSLLLDLLLCIRAFLLFLFPIKWKVLTRFLKRGKCGFIGPER